MEQLASDVELNFTLQTNGISIDKAWIDLFEKYNIGIGVSIDGPKEYHDKYRVDHKGRGSHDRVVEKINFFFEEARCRNMFSLLGALSVINPDVDAKACYRLFVDELKLRSFNFLLPDCNYCIPLPHAVHKYGKFMCEVFEAWTQDDDPEVNVTFCASSLGILFGREAIIYGVGPSKKDHLPLITIASNGDLSPVDELRSQVCQACCWEKLCGGWWDC